VENSFGEIMSPAKPKYRSRPRDGFVLITMMLSMLVLLGFLGLGVDVGYLQLVKTRMQTAADAAALGGVQDSRMNGSGGIVTGAKADAAVNGFTDGQNSVTVTVNHPPLSGNYTGDSTAVEVIISQNASTFFMQALGFSSLTVNARSVARQGAGSGCLFTLDPSMSGAFSASGGASVSTSCGISVASNNTHAMTLSGGASITASSVNIVGNYQVSGGASVSPAPVTGASAPSNPFSSLTPPSTAGCDYGASTYSVSGGATKTLSPGVYCGGISVSGGSHVTFSAGTYVLKGGGLSLSGGSVDSGVGVTFYNTAAAGYPYGAINFSGGTAINLTAPTTGAYAGILFYQDPSVGAAAPSTFSGGTSDNLTGALYFPTTALSYSGGSTGTAYTIIVADSITFSGGTVLNSNYSSLPGGSPVKGSGIVSE